MATFVEAVSVWRNATAKLAPYATVPLRLIVGGGFLAEMVENFSFERLIREVDELYTELLDRTKHKR